MEAVCGGGTGAGVGALAACGTVEDCEVNCAWAVMAHMDIVTFHAREGQGQEGWV